MEFNKKVKPGHVRITPEDNRLMTMPPYLNGPTTMPKWYKSLSKTRGMKKCAAINDYLSLGITIPLWSNLYFRPNEEDNQWESRIENMSPPLRNIGVSGFNYEDSGQCPIHDVRKIEKAQIPKIISPWRIETAPGWSCLFLPVLWEPSTNYDVLPSIVHTDFYHTTNLVLNIKANTDFMIPYGTPMYHIIPFKRTSDFDVIDFEDESYFKYVENSGFGSGFIMPSTGTAGPYRRTKHKIDLGLENKKSKWLIFGKK